MSEMKQTKAKSSDKANGSTVCYADEPIRVATLSGNIYIVGPEGVEVKNEDLPVALACGCVTK
jgi:hypothetical protein